MPAIGQPVQGYYYDQATDTLRPIAAQASTVDLPGRHRYAITPPPDLVDGQLWLDSDAVVPTYQSGTPTFASVAERDSLWTSPTNGSMCVTLDTYTMWLRKNGVWQPPPGTLVSTDLVAVPDCSATTTGLRDLLTVANFTLPYPAKTIVQGHVMGGFSGGASSFALDLFSNGTTSVVSNSPAQAYAAAAFYTDHSITSVSTVAAGVTSAVKLRITVTGTGGGTFHSSGTTSAMTYAQ